LTIESLKRRLADGTEEKLTFAAGVNVIVGAQNTGKSTWLRMLDYLMGGDGAPSTHFDAALIAKYRAILCTFRIGDKQFTLERNWTGDGSRSQCLLNNEKFAAAEISSLFMSELGIPELRYPQGNVFSSDRTWPTLGWRSLLRHIYRRQDYWSELVPKQPDSEQHACLLQFLGIAEHLFNKDQADLVDAQKAIAKLEAQKGFLTDLMNQLAVGLVDDPDLSVGLTEETILVAEARMNREVREAISRRDAILESVKTQAAIPKDELAILSGLRTTALEARDRALRKLSEIDTRKGELESYLANLQQEQGRLDRVDASSAVFANLKVTNCPACDQSVEKLVAADNHHCFLCGQHTDVDDGAGDASKRLQFERNQIAAELEEARELVTAVIEERLQTQAGLSGVEKQLLEIGARLLPFQSSAAAIMPQEASALDQTVGSLTQKIETVGRLRVPLQNRESLSAEIDKRRAEAKVLEASASGHEEKIEYEVAADRLSAGFNTYLNAIRAEDPDSWTKGGAVSIRIDERRTKIMFGDRPAKDQLGGTLTLFFLFAYHYALLSLSRFNECHYPGIVVLDLFPDIAKGVALGERIGLVLHPFIGLLARDDMQEGQVIMTSRDYTGDAGVNLIQLTHVWR
jgi:hypothetical protein